METKTWAMKLGRVLALGAILTFAIPMGISTVFDIPIQKTLSLIALTFTLEYFAVPAGIGLGLNPLFVLAVVTCVASSVVLLLFEIFDVAEGKKKVSDFLSKAREKAQKLKILQKYGVYGLVLAVPFLGFYVCPAVAWTLGWKRSYATISIIVGFMLISVIMALASIGVFKIIPSFNEQFLTIAKS